MWMVLRFGADSASYSYTAAGASHSVTCRVTDSASSPVTSPASNAVSVTVNPALVAPTVSASLGTITQGQTSVCLLRLLSTGTSPYSYQWLSRAPGAGSYSPISGATSSSYSFVTSISTATGSWSFELQVTDAVSAVVTSNAVSVMVNVVPTVLCRLLLGLWMLVSLRRFQLLLVGVRVVIRIGYQLVCGWGCAEWCRLRLRLVMSPGSVGSYSITADGY